MHAQIKDGALVRPPKRLQWLSQFSGHWKASKTLNTGFVRKVTGQQLTHYNKSKQGPAANHSRHAV